MKALISRAGWLLLALLLFVLFMAFGAMFASALFFEAAPTAEVLVTHAIVLIVSGAIAALCIAGASRCAWRALG